MSPKNLEACPTCRELHDPAEVHVCTGIAVDESKPMTREQALIYVQHLVIEYLKKEIVSFRENLDLPDIPELDRIDTELVIAVASALVKSLTTANTVVASASSRVLIPGCELPRGFKVGL